MAKRSEQLQKIRDAIRGGANTYSKVSSACGISYGYAAACVREMPDVMRTSLGGVCHLSLTGIGS